MSQMDLVKMETFVTRKAEQSVNEDCNHTPCTTLRTEIYTSEGEYSMVDYYAYLGAYQKK